MTKTTFRPSPARALLRATPVAAAVAATLATGAWAQTTPPGAAPAETITITGIRRGIESAISTKKNADSIVEAISAEDLGKLPDTSIAESMSRMTGVAAQRTAGRAQQISIRGMQPDMATSLLNNREQASTGDSRSVEFDQYPSELISSVLVYKTPQADRVNGGLSGTVNLQTVRPLDLSGRQVALSYRKNKLNVGAAGTEGAGDRYAIAYVDQFSDRRIGLALGFAKLDEEGGRTSRFESWGGGTAMFGGNTVNVPFNGFNAWADQENRERENVAATLQFRPHRSFTSTLDFFTGKFNKVRSNTGFQAPLNDSWNAAAGGNYDTAGVLTQATLSGSDVTAGTFSNVRAVVRNDTTAEKDKIESLGWENRFSLGGMNYTVDLARSTARRNGGIVETTAGTAQSTLGTAQLDSIAFTSGASFTPGLDYTNRSVIRLTDVQGWGGGVNSPQAGYSKLYNVKDTLDGLRLAAQKDVEWGPVAGWEAGVHLSDREKVRTFTVGRLVIGTDPLGSAAIPGGGTTAIPTPGGSLTVASFDSSDAIGSIYSVVRKLHPDIYNKDWRVEERVTSTYLRADLDTTLGGVPLRGNAGLQVAYADQRSTAFNVDRGSCASDTNCPAGSVSGGDKYTDVLPSVNLMADLGNAGLVRFAASRVMARPKVDDMRASRTYSWDPAFQRPDGQNGAMTGGGGNPQLQPYRANAFDISYEKYFGTKAYFSVAGFYKSLSSYILNIGRTFDYTGLATPGVNGVPLGAPLVGLFTQPVNGQGGSIQGVEVSVNLPLNMVSSWLDGFGAFVNHSDTKSSINLASVGINTTDINIGTVPLPGLSKRVTNSGIYFEKWGFSARVASRKRSDYLGEVTDGVGDRRYTFIRAETIVDAQVGYEIQSGFLKGLAVRFEVSNAGNEDYVRYRGNRDDEAERRKDGKFYQLGINYKL